MLINCISISHKVVDLGTLESFYKKKVQNIYNTLRKKKLEGFVLQTCLRTEIYWTNKDHLIEDEIKRIGYEIFNLDSTKFQCQLFTDSDAIRHLLRVVSGLESAIIGEYEILGQVRQALHYGKKEGTICGFLEKVLHAAINLGVKVRKDTNISKGNISIGSVAVEIIKEILGIRISSMVVIGAGDVAGLVGKALSKLEINDLIWMNRTYERSLLMTEKFSARPLVFNETNLRIVLKNADIIIFATGCTRRLLTKANFLLIDRQKPILLIDLGNPRNINPEVSLVPWVKLIDLEYINKWVIQNAALRVSEIPKVEQILEHAIHDLEEYLQCQWIEPIIAEIYQSAERIRVEQIEKSFGNIQLNEPECRICLQKIELLSKAIIKQLLDSPMRNIRLITSFLPPENITDILSLFRREQDSDFNLKSNLMSLYKIFPNFKESCEKQLQTGE